MSIVIIEREPACNVSYDRGRMLSIFYGDDYVQATRFHHDSTQYISMRL